MWMWIFCFFIKSLRHPNSIHWMISIPFLSPCAFFLLLHALSPLSLSHSHFGTCWIIESSKCDRYFFACLFADGYVRCFKIHSRGAELFLVMVKKFTYYMVYEAFSRNNPFFYSRLLASVGAMFFFYSCDDECQQSSNGTHKKQVWTKFQFFFFIVWCLFQWWSSSCIIKSIAHHTQISRHLSSCSKLAKWDTLSKTEKWQNTFIVETFFFIIIYVPSRHNLSQLFLHHKVWQFIKNVMFLICLPMLKIL